MLLFCIQQTLACKMYDEHEHNSPVIAIDTSNMYVGLQTAVNLVKQQIEVASR